MYDNYESDHRVRAGKRNQRRHIDESRMVEIVTLEDENGDEEQVSVPVKFEVCDTCDGRGKHVNPSIDCNGISAEEFYEDPDFAEEYASGSYDVTCYGCGGRRVVPVIDRDRVHPDVLKRIDDKEQADYEYRRMCEAERRYGC